jgi:hypothetical protein
MRRLPPEVRSLVEKAVYSLYTLRGYPDRFALVTDKGEIYVLDADGVIATSPRFSSVKEAPIGDVAGWRTTVQTNSVDSYLPFFLKTI